jgi:hypothetical protein
MKTFVLTAVVCLSGCADIGHIEALNDTPLRGVREVVHTLSQTQGVLTGHSSTMHLNTSAMNSKYGEAKGLNNIKYGFSDIPFLLQSVGYIVH